MTSTRIRSRMGSWGLGSSILYATVLGSGGAFAAEDPTVATEFRKQVEAYQSEAKVLDSGCAHRSLQDSPTQQQLTSEIDRLLKMPASKAQQDAAVEALKGFVPSAEIKRLQGLDPKTVAEYLTAFKEQLRQAMFVEDADYQNFQQNVCNHFCAVSNSMDLCALTNEEMATVAAAIDSPRLSKAFSFANGYVAKLKLGITVTLPSEVRTTGVAPLITFPVGALAGVATGATGLLTGNSAASAAFVNNAIEGLGKLIVDRAKQESIGWFLNQTGQILCGEHNWQQAQLENYFTPSLCSLAKKERLGGFGAGDALLESLKTSFTNDVRGWPGAMSGLAMGSVFWSEARQFEGKSGSILQDCWKSADCPAVHTIRLNTQEHVTNIFRGESAIKELEALALDLDKQKIQKTSASVPVFSSKATQLIACGMALQPEIQRTRPLFNRSFEGSSDPERMRHRAAVLAGLLKSRPCFRILGRGYRDASSGFEPATYDQTSAMAALEAPDDIERISTLVRLHKRFEVHMDAVIDAAQALKDAAKDYEVAVKAAAEALRKLQTDPPSVSKFDLKDAKAAEKFVNDLIRATKIEAQRKHIGAAIALSKAAIVLGQTTIAFVKSANNQLLVPGFYPALAQDAPFDSNLNAKLQQADEALTKIQLQLGALQSALEEDWATLVSQVFAGLNAQSKISSLAHWDEHLDVRHWEAIEGHIAQQLGFVLAILQAKNGDEMARALDTLASPPGGWRLKSQPDQIVVSITAHAGLFVGGEWRNGAYGVVHENFKYVYGVPPVLALPVGLEFARGTDCAFPSPFAVFFSVLDPAAFLQYDVNKDAKLPGPSVKTALAPGLGFRFGFKDTPFSLMPYLTYRPGFRQWEASPGGTGASALQLGVLASIDVTLFQFGVKRLHDTNATSGTPTGPKDARP